MYQEKITGSARQIFVALVMLFTVSLKEKNLNYPKVFL